MKVGDLVVRVFTMEEGIVINVCEDVVTTVDVLHYDGKILYDQRVGFYCKQDAPRKKFNLISIFS